MLMQKFTKYFFKNFLVFMAVYHIIVTILGYGILGGNSQTYISFIRDAIRFIFFGIILVNYSQDIPQYFKKWGKVWIGFIVLIVFSILVSIMHSISLGDILIGIKYGFFYMFIFLSATFIGYVGINKFSEKGISRLQYFFMFVMLFGFLWQILKIIKPDRFINLGYGKLDDFSYGTSPPIYYLTGYQGTMRRQGIFAGPNNYGYFLIAFLPLIMLYWGTSRDDLKAFIKSPKQNLNFLLTIIWIFAILLTLSRSAILGMILVFALLAKNWIKNHKRISLGIFIICIAAIVGLSFLKKESTNLHIQSKMGYIGDIIQAPLGYGLGSSGPAIHHANSEDQKMLPENYYMQIMLDIGTVGFIIWAICILSILIVLKNIQNYFKNGKGDEIQQSIYLQRQRLYVGLLALMLIGLFLHVFEDSMVNYIFFGIFGIYTGYLSKFYDPKKSNSIKELMKN